MPNSSLLHVLSVFSWPRAAVALSCRPAMKATVGNAEDNSDVKALTIALVNGRIVEATIRYDFRRCHLLLWFCLDSSAALWPPASQCIALSCSNRCSGASFRTAGLSVSRRATVVLSFAVLNMYFVRYRDGRTPFGVSVSAQYRLPRCFTRASLACAVLSWLRALRESLSF